MYTYMYICIYPYAEGLLVPSGQPRVEAAEGVSGGRRHDVGL